MYIRPLNVSTPKGQRVEAKIARFDEVMQIQVDFLDVVKKDAPPFAEDGVINFAVDREEYEETIIKLEKYLEDLFLKGMADEDLRRSFGIELKSGRVKAARLSRKARSSKRKGYSSSVHSGSRGRESAASDRPRNSNPEVAESSDPDSGKQDSERS